MPDGAASQDHVNAPLLSPPHVRLYLFSRRSGHGKSPRFLAGSIGASDSISATGNDPTAVCERYGLAYTTGRFSKQYGSVLLKIARLALPTRGIRLERSAPVSAPVERLAA